MSSVTIYLNSKINYNTNGTDGDKCNVQTRHYAPKIKRVTVVVS